MEKKQISIELYGDDQKTPPGLLPGLEKHFWDKRRDLIRALILTCDAKKLETFDKVAMSNPDMIAIIAEQKMSASSSAQAAE